MYFSGIREKTIQTKRLNVSYLEAGEPTKQLSLIHILYTLVYHIRLQLHTTEKAPFSVDTHFFK